MSMSLSAQGLHAAPHLLGLLPGSSCLPLSCQLTTLARTGVHTFPTRIHLYVDLQTLVCIFVDNRYMRTHAPSSRCAHMFWGLGEPCTHIWSNLQPSELTGPQTSPCRHPATSLSLNAPWAMRQTLAPPLQAEGLGLGEEQGMGCIAGWPGQGQLGGPSHRAGESTPDLTQLLPATSTS